MILRRMGHGHVSLYEHYKKVRSKVRMLVTTLTCAECLEAFKPTSASHLRAKFCSPRCRDRCHTRKKRLLHFNATVDEDISIGGVWKLSGGMCMICGEQVDRRQVAPHPRAASIDHITPLSRGGKHSWDNVQLAHFGCNSRKSNHLEVA